jgi:hypothetical protein
MKDVNKIIILFVYIDYFYDLLENLDIPKEK